MNKKDFNFQELSFDEFVDNVLLVMGDESLIETFNKEMQQDIKSAIHTISCFTDYLFANNIEVEEIKRKTLIDFILEYFRDISVAGIIIGMYVEIEIFFRRNVIDDALAVNMREAVDIVCKLLLIYIDDADVENSGGIN